MAKRSSVSQAGLHMRFTTLSLWATFLCKALVLYGAN
jgi:hypothetical protein